MIRIDADECACRDEIEISDRRGVERFGSDGYRLYLYSMGRAEYRRPRARRLPAPCAFGKADVSPTELIGIIAENKCSNSWFATNMNAVLDGFGWFGLVKAAKAAPSVVRFGASWLKKRYVEGVLVGGSVAVATAGINQELAGQDPTVGAAHGFLGFAGTYLPGVSTFISYKGTQRVCNPQEDHH